MNTTTPTPPRAPAQRLADEFLDAVYARDSAAPVSSFVFQWFEARFLEGAFPVCDAVLDRVDLARFGLRATLATLAVTSLLAEWLPRRRAFVARASAYVVAERTDADARALLGETGGYAPPAS